MTFPSPRLAAVLVVAALALSACGDEATAEVGEATVGTVVESVEAPAVVTARASARVTAPADGTVAEIAVRDGEVVAAGQPLVRVASPDAEARLANARAALAAVSRAPTVPQVDVDGLQAQVDAAAEEAFAAGREAAEAIEDPTLRAAALAKVERSESRYAAARAQSEAAVAAVNAGLRSVGTTLTSLTAAQRIQAQAAVSVAQDTVDALLVTAPIAGTVQLTASPASGGGGTSGLDSLLAGLPAELAGAASSALGGSGGGDGGATSVPTDTTLRVGDAVGTGSTLALVVDASALGLVAEVDETDVLQVRPGVTARAQVDAAPGADYPATVTAVDLAPTGSSRGGVAYRVQLALGPGLLDGVAAPAPLPGMSAVARLEVRVARDVVTVPVSAVVRDEGDDVVWVERDGRAVRVEVTLGAQGEDAVEVTSGVAAGDRVVVSGADAVVAGQDLPGA